eukprot:TRINITY_DN39_c0_g1_i1.p1 TRINITY_DN39_c0_g1~~TRINITY_DN39_c0_g1_i1.p1  ORF type:complete len:203 (+),score=60.38 TRINITY_DN39_c0_g1_i1:14-622(+)
MTKKMGKEEKRAIILDIFKSTKEPYTLPEIETLANKKGVVKQTIKEIVVELANDGDIKQDKIGATTVYWCFPSEETNKKKRKLEKCKVDIEQAKKKIKTLQSQQQELRKERPISDTRNENIELLSKLKEENVNMKAELISLGGVDPALIDAMREDIKVATNAANRWTDNIFTIKGWATKKYNMDSKTFDKNFGIPEEFDYVE